MFRKMLTLSFDDGTVQDKRFIELIDKYDLRATFNINSGFFGQKHRIDHLGFNVCHDEIEKEEIAEVYRNHEIAVHTVSHPNLRMLEDDSEVIRQVRDDFEALSAVSGKEIVGMAYPCGGACYDDRVIRLITENTPVRYARTTDSHRTFALPEDFMKWHPTCDQRDDRLMELAEEFINKEAEEDMLFYVWGHSYEFNNDNNWELIEEFCEKASGMEDVYYATNIEIYNYIMALKSLVFGVGCEVVYNPSAIPVWFTADGKAVKVEPGQTLKLV